MLLRFLIVILLANVTTLFASTQFRVLVDASASMRINDPDRLTEESLRLIADLAPEEESSLGVWLFGEDPKILLPEAVISNDIKTKLKESIQGYATADFKTDLEAAVQFVLDTPRAEGVADDAEQHWILVTDGVVDVGLDEEKNTASKRRILTTLKDTLLERGIHLHTISMVGDSDQELLKTLALKTDASFTEVSKPADLLMTFNRIFTMASTPNEVAFQGNTFLVDKSIEEFTLLVFHEIGANPQVIQPPDGRLLELKNSETVAVARSDHYTLITVKNPVVGKWQVENVDIEKSTIRIVTNLRAEASVIAPVRFINEPLISDISLFESDKKLEDTVILDLVAAKQTLIRLYSDKQTRISESSPQHVSGDFKNTIDLSIEEGDYELYSFLDGQTFTRKLSQFFSIIPPIELTVETKEYGFTAFTIKPTHLRLNVLLSRVMLEVNYDAGGQMYEEVPLLGIGFWQKVILPATGRFSARAQLIGETQAGVKFEYWTPIVEYTKPENSVEPNQALPIGVEDVTNNLPLGFSSDILPSNSTPNSTEESTDLDDSVDVDLLLAQEKQEETEELSISSLEIFSYVLINFAAFSVLGGLFWFYRRHKNRQQSV